MSARPHALILDRDPVTLAALSKRLEAFGVVPLSTASPSHAMRLLAAKGTGPVAAIVEFDAMQAGPKGRDGAAVLARLFSKYPDCETVVTIGNRDGVSGDRAIAAAHPDVAIFDKRVGDGGLVEWIDGVFSRSVGDIALDHGLVLHRPTLLVHRHFVGVQLVIRYPRAVTFRGDTASRAARRFSAWLASAHSNLTVIPHGDWKYRLVEVRR